MGFGVKTTTGNATAMKLINIIQEILAEAGWSKTSDTGQWNGVDAFTNVNEYVMWAMPTTGGLDPVLLKIQPANTTSAPRAQINLTIGNASNGSGTLTGTTWTGDTWSGAETLSPHTVFYAYDTGGVVICTNPTSGGQSQLFVLIERKRNAIGTPTNGSIGTMFFQGRGSNTVPPSTTQDVTVGLLGVSAFNTSSFAKTWGTKSVSSPIADSPNLPKSADGLTAPTQPVMFFGPDGGWYSNLILVVQPSEGGTAMQAIVNGSPRYYRTVSSTVAITTGTTSVSQPISGNTPTGTTTDRVSFVPAILAQ